MTDFESRLTRRNGKWHVMARRVAHGTAKAAWIDLGGCSCPVVALRVMVGCRGQDKR